MSDSSNRKKDDYNDIPENVASNGQESSSDAPPQSLNAKNVLNVIAYIANVVIVQLIGAAGVGQFQNNAALSAKYQTIVTPAGWAFSIWGVIYVFQAIFTVAQCLPRFRAHPLVQRGVGYWYVAACLFQIGWTFVFALEKIGGSLAFMILLWISLAGLVTCQYLTDGRDESSRSTTTMKSRLMEFWILKFPFSLHCGWITAATALNVNLVGVWKGAGASTQLTVGIVSLAVLLAVAVFVLFVPNRPEYTVAAVQAWATGAMVSELNAPKSSIEELFSSEIIAAVRGSAGAASVIVLILIGLRVCISFWRRCGLGGCGRCYRSSGGGITQDGDERAGSLIQSEVIAQTT